MGKFKGCPEVSGAAQKPVMEEGGPRNLQGVLFCVAGNLGWRGARETGGSPASLERGGRYAETDDR